jgi:hypothetical protein
VNRAALIAALGGLVAFTAPAGPRAATTHPVHLSYGRLDVEGHTATLRLRLFRDDLERALGTFGGAPVAMHSDGATDSLFARYFHDRLFVSADGVRLAGTVIASGADELMWWYEVRFDARATVRTMRIRNAVLFELYGDQTNIVKVVHFPSERQFALSFAPQDTAPQAIAFPAR